MPADPPGPGDVLAPGEQIEGGDLDAAVYARVDTPLGKARWRSTRRWSWASPAPTSTSGGIDATPGKGWWELKFSMSDGESFELQARGDVRGFVDAALDQRAS